MLEGIPFADLTAPTLLGVTVLLLLLGRLVPRATLTDKAVESEKWRQAYETERQARAASDAQTTELLELAKTTHSIVVAAFRNEQRQSGEANVAYTPNSQ